MSLLQTPVSMVDGNVEKCLSFKQSFAVVDIPLRSMCGTWTTSTICNYDEEQMHLRRLPVTSLMQQFDAPAAAFFFNWESLACGYDARNATTTAPTAFASGTVSDGSSFYPNNYLHRGEQYDSDLSLYYLRARYYNPNTGRFMSRDPWAGKPWIPKTLHKYLYADGNPVNAMDPRVARVPGTKSEHDH